jgi:hypothetical protein
MERTITEGQDSSIRLFPPLVAKGQSEGGDREDQRTDPDPDLAFIRPEKPDAVKFVPVHTADNAAINLLDDVSWVHFEGVEIAQINVENAEARNRDNREVFKDAEVS